MSSEKCFKTRGKDANTTTTRLFLVLTVCTWTREVGIFACILLLIVAKEDDVIELSPVAFPLCVLTTILEALPVGTDCPLSTILAAVNQTCYND